jgi:hypothetical protein
LRDSESIQQYHDPTNQPADVVVRRRRRRAPCFGGQAPACTPQAARPCTGRRRPPACPCTPSASTAPRHSARPSAAASRPPSAPHHHDPVARRLPLGGHLPAYRLRRDTVFLRQRGRLPELRAARAGGAEHAVLDHPADLLLLPVAADDVQHELLVQVVEGAVLLHASAAVAAATGGRERRGRREVDAVGGSGVGPRRGGRFLRHVFGSGGRDQREVLAVSNGGNGPWSVEWCGQPVLTLNTG